MFLEVYAQFIWDTEMSDVLLSDVFGLKDSERMLISRIMISWLRPDPDNVSSH